MIVCNATPLIAFSRIQRLDVLRKVAQSLDLTVTGTVGILIRAKQKQLIPAVGPVLEKMRYCGIRYSERFIQTVLQQVGE
jgi:hypothetical protein